MQNLFKTYALACAWLTASGCSTIEETISEPDLAVLSQEVQSSKNVGAVVLLPTLGADTVAEAAISDAAANAHGKTLRQLKHAKKAFKYLGAPKNFAKFVVAPFQARFAQKVAELRKSSPTPKSIDVADLRKAAKGIKEPKTTKDLRFLVKMLQPNKQEIAKMSKALYSEGERSNFVKPSKIQQKIFAISDRVNRYVFKKLKAKYALVTIMNGDENSWQNKKELKLSVGLVNINSGKLRYFASINTIAGAEDYNYPELIALMSTKLFNEVSTAEVLIN